MTIDDILERYWRYRLLEQSIYLGVGLLVGLIAVYIGGPIVLGCFIWNQIKLEKGFHDRYGQAWKEEYQKYHGSLAHAHFQIAVCTVALISIMAIGLWFYRQTRSRRIKRSRAA